MAGRRLAWALRRAGVAAAANIRSPGRWTDCVALATPSRMSRQPRIPPGQVGDSWTYNVLNGGRTVDTLTVAVAGASATEIRDDRW